MERKLSALPYDMNALAPTISKERLNTTMANTIRPMLPI